MYILCLFGPTYCCLFFNFVENTTYEPTTTSTEADTTPPATTAGSTEVEVTVPTRTDDSTTTVPGTDVTGGQAIKQVMISLMSTL